MAVNEVVVAQSPSQTVVVNNTTTDPVIVVENPTGVRTVDVLAGVRGVPGPVNVLTPGTITTGEPGTNASVTITGQSPNQVLNLTIPRGDVGASNVLDIGTVTTLHSGETPDVTITGTSPTQTLNISLPKGAEILSGTTAPSSGTGSQNDWYINTTNWDMYQKTSSTDWTLRLNLRGATGPVNTLSVGTVSTVGSTIPAATTITGTSPNQTLNLTLPRGSQTLSGTSDPAAGTGLIGDWYINTSTWDQFEKTDASTWTLRMNIKGLKGDKGDTGNTGPANQLSIGTVTTGAPGSTATANITGTAPVQTLSLTIPRGDVGATGPAPNLDVGTVTTGEAGSSAAATVTGTNPNYLINLTVPRGDKGDIGAQWYSGADVPDNSLYDDGDYFLITGISGTGDVYRKEGGTWNLEGNIRGLPGSGNVNSVNGILPDVNGQVLLNSHIIRPAGVSDSGNDTTTGYWSRIATITLDAQYQDFALKVSINSSETGADPNQGGFVAMNVRQNDPLGTAPAVRFDTYELRDMTPADLKYTVDATATESAVTFWIKSSRPYTKFTYFMVDQSNSVGLQALDFNQGEPRVASEPVGATANGNANWHVFQKEQLPAIAINDTFVVNSEAEMLALTAQVGDTAVRNDTSTTYILKTEPATVLANWIPLVFNASNLTQGTISDDVLPDRLSSPMGSPITDWNDVAKVGWYYSAAGSANAPTANALFGYASVGSSDSNIALRLWEEGTSTVSYVRKRSGGTWEAWVTEQTSKAAQDAAYVGLTGNQTIAGSKTFSSPIVIDRANGYTSTITDNNINFSRNGANYINLNNSLGQLLINGTTTTAGDTQILAMSATGISAYLPIAGQTPTATNHLTTKSYVDSGLSGKANTAHNHDTSNVTTGTFDIARIPTGTTSTTVALGNHLHAGVYEPVIAAGTTAQFRRGDNTWQNISGAMVDLSSNQTINGNKTFSGTLDVVNNDSGATYLRIGNTSTGASGIVLDSNGGDFIGADYAVIRHENDGKLSIRNYAGTTSFFANSNAGSTVDIQNGRLQVNMSANAADGLVLSQGAASSDSPRIFLGANNNTSVWSIRSTQTDTLVFSNAAAWGSTSGTPRVTFDSAGGVFAASFSGAGGGLTALNGSNISTGTVAPARLGSGTTNGNAFLRGDGVWASADRVYAAFNGTGLTAGWVRIASQAGGKGSATFTVYDDTSSVHNHVTFTASVSYNEDPQITVLNASSYSAVSITGIRIAQDKVTAGPLFANPVYLEVQIANTTQLAVHVSNNHGSAPWTGQNPSNTALGANYTTFTTVPLDGSPALTTTGEIHALNRLRSGFTQSVASASSLVNSAAEFELSSNSMISIGEIASGNAHPQITMYRTAAGSRAGRALRLALLGSDGPFELQYGSTNNANYGSETYTTVMSTTTSGGTTFTGGSGINQVVASAGGNRKLGLAVGASWVGIQFRNDTVNHAGIISDGTNVEFGPASTSASPDNWGATKIKFNVVNGTIQADGNITSGGGTLTLNNGTANTIAFTANGVNAPTVGTRSAGTKIVLYPDVDASEVDYAIGIEGSTLWNSIPLNTSTRFFRWYGGTTKIMELRGDGILSLTNAIVSTAGRHQFTNSVADNASAAGASILVENHNTNGSPSIHFHKSGINQAMIAMRNDGAFRLTNEANTAYRNLYLGDLYAAGVVQASATTNSLNLQRFEFTVASAARPTGSKYVEWVGPVEPTNAINGDTWVNTSA